MNPAAPLPADEAWEALRAQLEWRRGVGLFFLFAPHQGASKSLRERVTAWLQVRTLRVRQLRAGSAEHLRLEMIAALFDEAKQAPAETPLWIEAEAEPFDEAWNRARAVFLARLNERRGALEADVHGPLIIVLPLTYRQETRAIAPDLWHVRVWSGDLPALAAPASSSMPAIRAEVSAMLPAAQSSGQFVGGAQVEESLRAWQAVIESAGPARDRIHLGLGLEAFDRAFEAMQYSQAKSLAQDLVTLARERASQSDYGALRDLSISLNKVGEVAEALGQYEAARTAYTESLDLRRKINAAMGDMPQGMRDLSVSLDKLGGVNQSLGEYEVARAAYLESLTLCRKINAATNETPMGLRELSVVLNHVGWVDQILGSYEYARAAYTESLDLSRKISASAGESPQSLHDLSVSLERIGGLDELLGHFEAARAAYAECLELRRKINATAGETPQRLRDLGISISKAGGVDQALGLYDASRFAAKESLELFRKINTQIGETPQGLFDLAAALLRMLSFLKADDDAKVADEMRREAHNLLARLQDSVGAYWEGNNLNELIKTLGII